jgi:hypothetical protein
VPHLRAGSQDTLKPETPGTQHPVDLLAIKKKPFPHRPDGFQKPSGHEKRTCAWPTDRRIPGELPSVRLKVSRMAAPARPRRDVGPQARRHWPIGKIAIDHPADGFFGSRDESSANLMSLSIVVQQVA